MSKKIENLRDLFIEQGRELFDASKQEQKELPKIKKQASNPELKKVLDHQLSTAINQTTRLKDAFKKLNESPLGEKNECCKSVINQTRSLMNRSKDPSVRDAAIINSIQRLNHSKITGLGSLKSYAMEIGQQEIANSVQEILAEEKMIDKNLSNLATSKINKEALASLAV